jgi:hypothetical protein
LLKEDAKLLLLAFGLLGFWLFGCGRLLKGRVAGGRLLKWENE